MCLKNFPIGFKICTSLARTPGFLLIFWHRLPTNRIQSALLETFPYGQNHQTTNYILNLLFQLIFRKVADVKRERELAEKRKNEPPLDLASDHPVRKLISRFRKMSDNKLSQNTGGDAEKGENGVLGNHVGNDLNRSDDKSIKIMENDIKVVNVNETTEQQGGKAKWGKFLAGGGPQMADNNTLGPNSIPAPAAGGPPRLAAKPSKWGRLGGKNKQDTIEEEEEMREGNGRSNLRKAESTDSGILKSDARLDQIEEEGAPLTQRDVSLSIAGSSLSAAEQQLISSLYDIKIEIKEEIENLNVKMTKIDDQIGDILKMFTPASSPYSSHTPSSLSSRINSTASSNSSTASNSIVTSPKGSVPSSPHRHSLEHMPSTNVDGGANNGRYHQQQHHQQQPPPSQHSQQPHSEHRTNTPPSRKSSGGSSGSLKMDTKGEGAGDNQSQTSRRSSPNHSDSSSTNSGGGNGHPGGAAAPETGRKKRRRSAGSKTRVAPSDMDPTFAGGITPAQDDDSVPTKDRDLDIL